MKKALLFASVFLFASIAWINHEGLFALISEIEQESMSMPLASALLLIVLKAISAPLGFPGTPLTLLSGSLFGHIKGTIIALIGNTLGASLAFLLSRYVLRDYVERHIEKKYPKVRELDARIKEKGFSTVVALRLIPLFPFNALNFLLGLTGISFQKYVLGSFLGMIPGTFLFVYFGESLRMLSGINIFFAVLGIVLLTYIGKFYQKRF